MLYAAQNVVYNVTLNFHCLVAKSDCLEEVNSFIVNLYAGYAKFLTVIKNYCMLKFMPAFVCIVDEGFDGGLYEGGIFFTC